MTVSSFEWLPFSTPSTIAGGHAYFRQNEKPVQSAIGYPRDHAFHQFQITTQLIIGLTKIKWHTEQITEFYRIAPAKH